MRRSTRLRAALATVAVAGTLGVTAAATSAPASAHDADDHTTASRELTPKQRQFIHQATKQYRDPAAAVAAGYLPTDACAAEVGLGGMGFHYVNLAEVFDPEVDPAHPDVLVYVPTQDGGRTLGAAEWMGVDPDQDVTTDFGRPSLFDTIAFDGPMLGHEPGMPVHFDLHVWLYKHNPAGMLTPFNPAVSC